MDYFGYSPPTDVIPPGMYCYTFNDITVDNSITLCPYYKSVNDEGKTACLYTGFVGYDLGHYDQCKVCSINKPSDSLLMGQIN